MGILLIDGRERSFKQKDWSEITYPTGQLGDGSLSPLHLKRGGDIKARVGVGMSTLVTRTRPEARKAKFEGMRKTPYSNANRPMKVAGIEDRDKKKTDLTFDSSIWHGYPESMLYS